jgi:hypothetical protein
MTAQTVSSEAAKPVPLADARGRGTKIEFRGADAFHQCGYGHA